MTIEGRDVPGITEIRPLSTAESDAYERCVAHLAEFGESLSLLPLTAANLDAFCTYIRDVDATPMGVLQNEMTRRALTAECNRLLVNFLATARLFLDHTEARLKRRYGATSPVATQHDAATAEAYDDHREYRVMYSMRNYIQHVGLPIEDVVENARFDPKSGQTTHTIRTIVEPKTLLTRYGKWRGAARDLKSLVGDVPLAQFSTAFFECLRRIEQKTHSAEREPLQSAGRELMEILKDGVEEGSRPTVLADFSESRMRFIEPPWTVLQIINVVRFETPGPP